MDESKKKTKKRKPNIEDSLADSFVLVLTEPPNLEIQVLDDRVEPRRVLLHRLVVGVALLYNAVRFTLKCYLEN